MPKSLVVKCPQCSRAKQALDTRRSQATELGKAVRRAAKDGLVIELAGGSIDVGCECTFDEAEVANAKQRWRITIRQILLLITVIAILLSIFRHPISLMFRSDAKTAAWAPWSFYGWLFFGWEVVNVKNLSKNPITMVMLLSNVVLAILAPILAIIWGFQGFKFLWDAAKDDDEEG